MKNNTVKLMSALVITSGVLACSSATVESDSIDNDAIWAGIRITSENGVSSGINVEMNVGGSTGTNLVLSSGDRVIATSGSLEVELTEDTDFLDVDYEGAINTGASGDEIVISLERANSADISNSRVTLPDTFTINFPQENMMFTQLQNIEVLWTAGTASDEVSLVQAATCKDASNQDVGVNVVLSVPDTGSYTTDFLPVSLAEFIANGGCNFSFEIQRTNTGTLDPGFGEGGFIRARQSRTVGGMRVEL